MRNVLREAFEANTLKMGGSIDRVVPGEYRSSITECGWVNWQAATLAERERCALVWDGVKDFEVLFTVKEISDAIRMPPTATPQGGAL